MSPPDVREHQAIRRFWGALMMAVGALIATLCGGCALVVATSFVFSSTIQSQWPFLLVPALVGGLPAVGGVVVFQQGLKRFQDPRPERNTAETFD